MELFASITGIKMSDLPYKGSPPALNEMVGGRIQLMFSTRRPLLRMIQSGKVRALSMSPKGSRHFPTRDRRSGPRAGLRGAGLVHGRGARHDAGARLCCKLRAELKAVLASRK